MSFGLLNAAMLAGLLGAAVPVVIHVLNRRRDPVVEWAAMQFLDAGRRSRQKFRLTEALLMAARMALLAAVALAAARPFLTPAAGQAALGAAGARDVVLIIDGSARMDRTAGGATARRLAIAWARAFVAKLGPGDSVAVLSAGHRVRPVVDPAAFDKAKVDAALAALAASPGGGSGDLAAALAEAFRVLERGQNPAREVVVLSDGRRAPWRPGDVPRWALVRDLAKRLDVPPRVTAAVFASPPGEDDGPDAALGNLTASRPFVTPGLPLDVSVDLTNAGPAGDLSRTARLFIDGRPATAAPQPVGPLPVGGKAVLSFGATLDAPGSHLLTVALDDADDPLPANDTASVAVEVVPALSVLLVDGEPGREPFGGETDFLRAALAPGDDESPRAVAEVVAADRFNAASLKNKQVLILANVERLNADQSSAVGRFLDAGGGVLVAPGDRVDAEAYNALDWLPAKLGPLSGDFAARKAVAHPAPATFSGPALPPLARGDAPALGGARLFAYFKLESAPGASVSARLDTGDAWAVERPRGRGRALIVAGPLDAEGGTLPANPDFVPLVHEWALHLAGGGHARPTPPGEPIVFERTAGPPTTDVTALVQTPSGRVDRAALTRDGGRLRARFDDTVEAGVYRLTWPDSGEFAYAVVPAESRTWDPSPLEPAEAARLAEGWPRPFAFDADPNRLTTRLLAADGPAARREVWRGLVLFALFGLCAEIYLTRRLVKGRGIDG